MNETRKDLEFEEIEATELGTELLNDETITQEAINEMKMLGVSKPSTVSWERWNRLQSERIEHTHMIHLAASGVPQGKIAKTLGYDQAHVSKVLNTPEIKAKILTEVKEIYGEDHKKALKDRVVKAVGVIDDVLDSGKEAERASMAKWVVEHSIGKAQNTTEHKVNLLGDIQVHIAKYEQNQLREVGENPNLLPKPIDPFDTVINEVIPEGFTVGVRSNSEKGSTK